jgi:high-affinity nickel-transport protein
MLLLAATGLLHGLRHGVDWDHIAAISDLTGANDRRRGLRAATAYALGHGLVILVLGLLAVLGNDYIPDSLDGIMGRVVGVTLIVLGVSVAVGLARDRRNFRMRSRWTVVGSGVTRAGRWARDRVGAMRHDHPHSHDGHGHGHAHTDVSQVRHGNIGAAKTKLGHSHEHVHIAVEPRDPFAATTPRSAVLVGMLHGVGAESPTQVVVLVGASQAAGHVQAIVVLLAFVLGLLCSNTGVALATSTGFLSATRSFRVYATIALLCAAASTAMGILYLFGGTLPGLLG